MQQQAACQEVGRMTLPEKYVLEGLQSSSLEVGVGGQTVKCLEHQAGQEEMLPVVFPPELYYQNSSSHDQQ